MLAVVTVAAWASNNGWRGMLVLQMSAAVHRLARGGMRTALSPASTRLSLGCVGYYIRHISGLACALWWGFSASNFRIDGEDEGR